MPAAGWLSPGVAAPLTAVWIQQTRPVVTNKHWDPKWRKLRARKVLKVSDAFSILFLFKT